MPTGSGSTTRFVAGARRALLPLATAVLASACTSSGLDLSSQASLGLQGLAPAADVGVPAVEPPSTLAAKTDAVMPLMRNERSVATADQSAEASADPVAALIADATATAPIAKPTEALAMMPVEERRPSARVSLFGEPKTARERRAERRGQRRVEVAAIDRSTTAGLSALSPRNPDGTRKKSSGRMSIIRPKQNAKVLSGVRSVKRLYGLDRNENGGARSFRVASAAGLARLSAEGFVKQSSSVDTACLKPKLLRALRDVERHFGQRVVITSGYRSPRINARAGGVKGSKHLTCEAADFQVEGVSRSKVAAFLRSMPDRGGVGTYCHTKSVHYDIGSKRDWSWGCRKRG